MSRRDRVTGAVCAIGASLILTMRQFQALPEPEPRHQIALVRLIASGDGLDPREILPDGAILTMPYQAAGPASLGEDPAGHPLPLN